MSAAGVTFHRLDDLDAPPGREQTFSFNCPRHRKGARCEGLVIKGRTNLKHDPQGKNGGIAQWDWVNADCDAPTFQPSINCGGCGWHGFIERGRCVNTARQDEPETK